MGKMNGARILWTRKSRRLLWSIHYNCMRKWPAVWLKCILFDQMEDADTFVSPKWIITSEMQSPGLSSSGLLWLYIITLLFCKHVWKRWQTLSEPCCRLTPFTVERCELVFLPLRCVIDLRVYAEVTGRLFRIPSCPNVFPPTAQSLRGMVF